MYVCAEKIFEWLDSGFVVLYIRAYPEIFFWYGKVKTKNSVQFGEKLSLTLVYLPTFTYS